MDLKRTRWVRRLEDGSYTIESNTSLNKQKLLCDMCGIASKCPINETRLKLHDAGARFHLNSCIRYVPLLAFRKPIIGLDAPYFNTLRSGVTWRDRVEPDKLVCLVEADTGNIIRFGRVDKVYSGPVDEMLRKHSRFNHLCMGGEKIEKVGEVIRKSYGHFLNDDSLLTAIYIRHVDREFDTEYHSAEELNLVDPRPKAGVIDISVARQKPPETF
ncbi:hypothetical protein UXP91_21585 [Enterobacter hormaechei]|uniref:hypothetical protein n=1 Tax=Enterobacter cloacae complex TaxID=354276 RepID=UPI0020760ADD|nr:MULTISPECIES: hypothetical protein [Enterobacter cloacae complex]EJD7033467.1 hypothetical protein [Enterobacter hormaechei]MCM7452106.1 hypothetical protein [Enterobacter cloacae]MCM8070980.1 hypothetical protein [Enterobacter hormaechei]MCM8118292.1 hypothetical protein [Enterobacter hormaechei]MCM8202628.1 hypothetical protein [Enterobacter hormaechei]